MKMSGPKNILKSIIKLQNQSFKKQRFEMSKRISTESKIALSEADMKENHIETFSAVFDKFTSTYDVQLHCQKGVVVIQNPFWVDDNSDQLVEGNEVEVHLFKDGDVEEYHIDTLTLLPLSKERVIEILEECEIDSTKPKS
jgi:hypothetical protein